jgi:glucosamine-6-phosphate deaminase
MDFGVHGLCDPFLASNYSQSTLKESAMETPLKAFAAKQSSVRIYSSKSQMGRAAAFDAAQLMREAISQLGHARIIMATGNSQIDMVTALTTEETLDWEAVEVFHMDEYFGMPSSHPASFAHWIKIHVTDVVGPGKVHYLRGDSPDPEEDLQHYGASLTAEPIDLCILGFGENGHIAFNDPHTANFNDPLVVKRVSLDKRCREQQVGEGHFPSLEAVPEEAITLTCPTLMSARNLICCVPERRKAEALRNALQGPLSEACPGSLVVTHPRATIYSDTESSALLSPSPVLQ